MEEGFVKYLLEKTITDYNKIAEHFSKTRSFAWEEMAGLANYTFAGERILDLGCGNGRLRTLFKEIEVDYIGIDSSERLIELAKQSQGFKIKTQKFIVGTVLDLPFPANYFDKVFSIAVFHHIPSGKYRLKFLREARRVLKPEGLLILTVWNLWQKRFFLHHLKSAFLKIIGKSKLDFKDIFYPWESPDKKVMIQRYLHGFTTRELKTLVKRSGLEIKEVGYLGKNKRNLYLIAKKVHPELVLGPL